MLNCSIMFTFGHEFQHLLQFKYGNKVGSESELHENVENREFVLRNHIWEYDADRMACYEVLKYIFRRHIESEARNDEKLIVMMFLGCASMIITKTLFYFGIANQIVPNLTIKNTKFYTKRTSHPHPLVRALNIMECFIENINNDFPRLKVDEQALLNNTMSIMKLYFNRLTPGQNAINNLFEELFSNIELINAYNGELNECARKNDVIRGILTSRYIQFK